MGKFTTLLGLAVLAPALGGPAVVGPHEEIPREAAALYTKLAARVSPRLEPWINEQAGRLRQAPAGTVPLSSRQDAAKANMRVADGDIEALAFIVLMRATNDIDQDLKTIMAEVKARTAAKQKLRDLLNTVNQDVARNAGKRPAEPCVPPACGGYLVALREVAAAQSEARAETTLTAREPANIFQLRALAGGLKSNLDSMNEMSEMTSVRLQMMMDRRTKFISTLSNIMRKISSTQDTLIQNLK